MCVVILGLSKTYDRAGLCVCVGDEKKMLAMAVCKVLFEDEDFVCSLCP